MGLQQLVEVAAIRKSERMALLQKAKLASRALFDSRYRYLYRQRAETDRRTRTERACEVAKSLPQVAAPSTPLGDELHQNGIVFLNDLISAEAVADMREWFTDAPAQDPHRPALGTFTAPGDVPEQTHVAYIDAQHVASAPHGLELANHPSVIAAVTQFLGAKPTISYMTSWWSMPRGGDAEGPENFHRDWDDYRFVKLFLYLTDVDENSGPHAFVRGSHESDRLMERRRFSDEEVEAAFPAEDRMIITGPAGSHFLETTFGVHRGIPPVSDRRLIFQVLYTLSPHISGPLQPVMRLPAERRDGVDPYTNRIFYSFD